MFCFGVCFTLVVCCWLWFVGFLCLVWSCCCTFVCLFVCDWFVFCLFVFLCDGCFMSLFAFEFVVFCVSFDEISCLYVCFVYFGLRLFVRQLLVYFVVMCLTISFYLICCLLLFWCWCFMLVDSVYVLLLWDVTISCRVDLALNIWFFICFVV